MEKYIRDKALIHPGSLVLAAFSGGPDSTAMVHVLHLLQESLLFRLLVCHVNHLLRGRESERDEAFARDWAKEQGVPCYLVRQDVRAFQHSKKLSLEEAARIVRYRALNDVAGQTRADTIALGHHFDDQVETVLMHIMRGTGLRGLRGMQPRSGKYIRPLIEVRKEDILDYLHAQHIPYRIDSTNQDSSFLRNRVRHHLLPLLEGEYNPRIRESIWRLSRNAGEQLSESGTSPSPSPYRSTFNSYPLSRLSELNRKDMFEELSYFLGAIYQGTTGLSRSHLEGLIHMVRSGKGEMNLPEKVKVWIEGHYLFGSRHPVLIARIPHWVFILCYPGKNRLEQAGIFLDFEINPDCSRPVKGDWVVTVDEQAVKPPCSLRNFRPGDQVMSKGKMRKLKEVFADFGIPVEWRRSMPILCDRENILWIPGLVLDERIQVGENSKSLLRIRVGKIAG